MSRPPRFRRDSRRSPKKPSYRSEELELTVDSLAGLGDGLAHDQGGRLVYVALGLPGDQLRVKTTGRRGDALLAEIVEVLTPGPDRVTPPCPHFGTCGGCTLQHLQDQTYRDWKRQAVVDALQRHSLHPEIEEARCVAPGHRRRASFSVTKVGKGLVFGFNGRQSHTIEDIETCPLLTAEMNALIPPLRKLATDLLKPGQRGEVVVNIASNLADIVLGFPGQPNLEQREALSDFANQYNLARLSWMENGEGDPEPVSHRSPSLANFDGINVAIPAGTFLQPSKAGETILRELVLDAVGDSARVLDLYAGCGTFSLPLSRKSLVLAVESNPLAMRALETAAGRADLGGRVTARVRDLVQQPLSGKELQNFDAVVFDPPRAGAREQCEDLAQSSIPLIVGVSCNPSTFARDAQILCEGGYELVRVVPVDQFTWSSHVEVVGVFKKQVKASKR